MNFPPQGCHSASLAAREAVWLKAFLAQLKLMPDAAITLKLDNQSSIDFITNQGSHAKSKHIDIAYHFIRERVMDKSIVIEHCPSKGNLADIFTKALPRPAFENLVSRISMVSDLRGSVDNK